MQLNMVAHNPHANELKRVTSFGNPEFLPLLCGKTETHVDGTFLCSLSVQTICSCNGLCRSSNQICAIFVCACDR